MTETPKTNSCWPWQHEWSKWTDKAWAKLVRSGLLFVNATTTAPEEIGMECVQERRCQRCGKLQLRSEQTRL